MQQKGCPWLGSYSAAAYMAESVTRLLAEPPAFASPEVRQYAHYRSGFTLQKPKCLGSVKHETFGSVLGKIAQRGIPAPCSLQVERYVLKEAEAAELLDFTEEEGSGAFVFRCTPRRDNLATLLQACCIPELLLAEDEVNALLQRYRSLCTESEQNFFDTLIGELPDPRLGLLFLPQRLIDSMGVQDHHDERVDFALEVPDYYEGWLKLVIEIDDRSHTYAQMSKDRKRDRDLNGAGWTVFRFPLGNRAGWQEKLQQIVAEISRAIPPEMLTAAETLRHMEAQAQAALCNLVMLPVAEAQITAAVAQVVYTTGKSSIRIGNPQNLPLEPVVAAVRKTVNAVTALHTPGEMVTVTLVSDVHQTTDLIYYGYPSAVVWDALAARDGIVLAPRQVWSEYVEPFLSASPHAVAIDNVGAEAMRASLKHLLRNVFRKVAFRPKQQEIIERTLSLRPVIGLLPTAAGKSLCYQLPSLLQPGFCFIVDPLRSLMIDQKSSLEAMGIHRCHAFMSGVGDADTKDAEIRQRGYEKIERGEFLFVFNAPERLQIPEFIDLVNRQMGNINYCVVDEAHCVSEWGHDFRLAYMNVWRRMGEYAVRKPTFIALTGTASQNVLVDIKHILKIYEPEAVIEPSTFDRAELIFEVHRVSEADRLTKITQIVRRLINDPSLAAGGTPSGLIFSNFAEGDVGVTQIAGELRTRIGLDVPMYFGRTPAGISTMEWEQEKAALQLQFKNDQISHLVCTNSFGMGIDKPNIRFTVHAMLPKSLEDFYQQAGRAGRDQAPSQCVIVFADEEPEAADRLLDPEITPHDALTLRSDYALGQREDAVRSLWFLRQTFRGAWYESRALYYTVYNILVPRMPDSGETKRFDYSILDFPPRYATTGDPAKASATDLKQTLEMALHRCYLTGAIADYAYDYTGKRFRIDLKRIDATDIYSHLVEYLGEHMTEAELRILFKDRQMQHSYEETAYDCGCILIEYMYETIEKRRRRAILHMLQAARDGAEQGPKMFRKALLEYLEASAFTKPVKQISRSDDHRLWLEVLAQVQGMDDLTQLLGACRRQLEEYPSHPGLLILAGFCRAAGATPEEGVRDLAEGFRNLKREHVAPEVCGEVEDAIINHTRRLMPSREPDISRAIQEADVPIIGPDFCEPEPFDLYEEQQLLQAFEQFEEFSMPACDPGVAKWCIPQKLEQDWELYVDLWDRELCCDDECLDESYIDPDVAIQVDELRQRIRFLQDLLLDTQRQEPVAPEVWDETIQNEIDALKDEIADLKSAMECSEFPDLGEFVDEPDDFDEADFVFKEVSDLIELEQRRIQHDELQFAVIEDERRWQLMEVMPRLKSVVSKRSEPNDQPGAVSDTIEHRRRQARVEGDSEQDNQSEDGVPGCPQSEGLGHVICGASRRPCCTIPDPGPGNEALNTNPD
ncbi:MAG: hypothetical protein CVV31_04435 [Methanomicrobiales archaeon HGW-Methanomicrobiales-2]|nr:MAG: hypothetical protein CVV31_04435 [Methanomicrobiales archaeon HGW-Methanomicrobiales-2]